MAKVTYYAVRKGKIPGVYNTWAECESNVKGFPGAEYKKFGTEDAAREYIDVEKSNTTPKAVNTAPSNTNKTSQQLLSDEELSNMQSKAYASLDWMRDNGLLQPDTYDAAKSQVDESIANKKNYRNLVSGKSFEVQTKHADVFVDGSYNADTNEYGYGVYMKYGNNKQILCGRGECQEGGRNIEGEVEAARAALAHIVLHTDCTSVTLYHDYQGIGSWADKDWKANKYYTVEYAAFVNNLRDKGLEIDFQHVDGHTGVRGNEYVDKLAKISCDIPLTASEKSFISELENVPGYPSQDEPATDMTRSDDSPSFA
jgi:ribonuclease HI